MRKSLQPQDLGDLLTQAHCATLATHQPDGSMLLAPVWHEWADGGFTMVIDGKDPKVRNLRRDARLSVVVAEDKPPYRGIEVRGTAKFFDSSAAPVFERLAARYLREYDFESYLERMAGWGAEALVLRAEPGILRVWDFKDEEW